MLGTPKTPRLFSTHTLLIPSGETAVPFFKGVKKLLSF